MGKKPSFLEKNTIRSAPPSRVPHDAEQPESEPSVSIVNFFGWILTALIVWLVIVFARDGLQVFNVDSDAIEGAER